MQDDDGALNRTNVQILVPDESNLDLSKSTLVSLGTHADINANGIGKLPFNSQTIEVGYLLDADNNVLLAGFISDERKELSVETTAEVILYYGLGYYLLPDNAKSAF